MQVNFINSLSGTALERRLKAAAYPKHQQNTYHCVFQAATCKKVSNKRLGALKQEALVAEQFSTGRR